MHNAIDFTHNSLGETRHYEVTLSSSKGQGWLRLTIAGESVIKAQFGAAQINHQRHMCILHPDAWTPNERKYLSETDFAFLSKFNLVIQADRQGMQQFIGQSIAQLGMLQLSPNWVREDVGNDIVFTFTHHKRRTKAYRIDITGYGLRMSAMISYYTFMWVSYNTAENSTMQSFQIRSPSRTTTRQMHGMGAYGTVVEEAVLDHHVHTALLNFGIAALGELNPASAAA